MVGSVHGDDDRTSRRGSNVREDEAASSSGLHNSSGLQDTKSSKVMDSTSDNSSSTSKLKRKIRPALVPSLDEPTIQRIREQRRTEWTRKKLRCCELDLKIIVGRQQQESDKRDDQENDTKGAEDNDEQELTKSAPDLKEEENPDSKQPSSQEEFWYPSTVMANYSQFIDTHLSECVTAATKGKLDTMTEIRLPDVSPDTWKDMIKYLESPCEARLITVRDALRLAPHYDKYEFTQGRRLCDSVLLEYTSSHQASCHPPFCMSQMVDVLLVARDCHLTRTTERGMENVLQVLTSRPAAPCWRAHGPSMFSEADIERLVPLLIDAVDDDRYRHLLKSSWRWSRAEMRSPLFPRLFVATSVNELTQTMLVHEAIDSIVLSGTAYDTVNGRYTKNSWIDGYSSDKRNSIVCWNGVLVRLHLGRRQRYNHRDGRVSRSGNWVIYRSSLPQTYACRSTGKEVRDYSNLVETVCWECPGSASLPLPPRCEWIAKDPLARGEPQIDYVFAANRSHAAYK